MERNVLLNILEESGIKSLKKLFIWIEKLSLNADNPRVKKTTINGNLLNIILNKKYKKSARKGPFDFKILKILELVIDFLKSLLHKRISKIVTPKIGIKMSNDRFIKKLKINKKKLSFRRLIIISWKVLALTTRFKVVFEDNISLLWSSWEIKKGNNIIRIKIIDKILGFLINKLLTNIGVLRNQIINKSLK